MSFRQLSPELVDVSNVLLKRLSCDVEKPIEVRLGVARFSLRCTTNMRTSSTNLNRKHSDSNCTDTCLWTLFQRDEVGGGNTSRTLGGLCIFSSLILLAINESMASIRLSLIIYPGGREQTVGRQGQDSR